ncbi:MAG: hypothetical protein ACR9NN_00415 [Nostochopsis sp.]
MRSLILKRECDRIMRDDREKLRDILEAIERIDKYARLIVIQSLISHCNAL